MDSKSSLLLALEGLSSFLLSELLSILLIISSIFLKKSVRPLIVSFNLSCSSLSSIPSNMFAASPNDDLSFIPPIIVNNINCKYFQIIFFVFSLTFSQEKKILKFTFGRNSLFVSSSSLILNISSF